jgi:holliday junction DNA helicase RuvA
MIAFLRGTVVDISLTHVVLDVGGVGYMVYTTGATLASLQEDSTTTLYTHFVVREDAHDLYGFTEKAERTFFMLVLTVSGIGPKSALQILDKAHYARLREALSKNDMVYLTKMAGIGQKTAQKLVLELRDKIGAVESGAKNENGDALEALTVLGYSLDDARTSLEQVPADVLRVEARVKAALRLLGKK